MYDCIEMQYSSGHCPITVLMYLCNSLYLLELQQLSHDYRVPMVLLKIQEVIGIPFYSKVSFFIWTLDNQEETWSTIFPENFEYQVQSQTFKADFGLEGHESQKRQPWINATRSRVLVSNYIKLEKVVLRAHYFVLKY